MSAPSGMKLSPPPLSPSGAWTLTTLDNGVVSNEHWTTVDADDELEWAVLHYSGAAAAAGQSYVGALLCSADGRWPRAAATGAGRARVEAAFAACGLKMWELYGHGPPEPRGDDGDDGGDGGEDNASFMWSDASLAWARENPPPLERIGDQTVTQWRKAERAKARASSE